jgi:hypothetical protein
MEEGMERSRRTSRGVLCALALASLLGSAACNEYNGTEPWPDVYLPESEIDRPKGGDAGAKDGAVVDAGEGGAAEAGASDGSVPDAGASNGGMDSGSSNGGIDAGTLDAGADAGDAEAGTPDAASLLDATATQG